MATSSIFAQVVIDTPSKLESFLKALEQSEKNAENRKPMEVDAELVTDPEKIRRVFARRGMNK